MTLYEKVVMLCKNKGIERSNLGNALGIKLTRGTVSKWQKGVMPRASTLKAIADYFGVTIDYLTNDEIKKEPITESDGFLGEAMDIMRSLGPEEQKQAYRYLAYLQATADKQ